MKLFILLIIGICILHVDARKFRRKNNAWPKFLSTDDELSTKEKIQTFVTSTLQFTLSTIDDIHNKSNRTFDAFLSDVSLRASYITLNLIEHFRKYRDAYQHYKKQSTVRSCMDQKYTDLETSVMSLQTRAGECRNSATTDIQFIKKEINENTNELKHGLKSIIELVNTCTDPWIPGESVKCARQRAEQIRKTVVDIQDISKRAHQNILNRLEEIMKSASGCAEAVINKAKSEEQSFVVDLQLCAAGLNLRLDI